jgi:hypothetical protein
LIAETFLLCALAGSAQFSGSHELLNDDAKVFHELLEPLRKYTHKEPPILFAYNYFQMAEQLRSYGLRAYSMTIVLSMGHLRGEVMNLPFAPGSLGAVVILQKLVYAELFEAIDPVSVGGVFMIEDQNMPHLAEVIMSGMGFKKSLMRWHNFAIYRRFERKEYRDGSGFDVFNAKKVMSPGSQVVHRGVVHARRLFLSAA